jgi:hypothetical protein
MTRIAQSLAPLAALAVLLASAAAQNLIPPPGPTQAGYYIEFGDQTTLPAGVSPAATPSVWQPQAAAMGVPSIARASCDDCQQHWAGACDSAGGNCGLSDCMPCQSSCGLWAHTCTVYASVLYLRPRNADVAYAVPIDGPITQNPPSNPLQVGPVGLVDPDYETGFDAGINLALNSMTSIYADVLMLDSSSASQIGTAAPDVLRSLVSHPSSTSAATDFLTGSADLGIDLDVVNLGLRHLFVGGQVYAVNYLVGARYGRLDQQFAATFVDNGTEQVATELDFDGGGLSLGLEAERQACTNRLRIYSRGAASFLAGKFHGNYFQGQSFDPTVVDTSWEAGRIVPVLDLELGVGWTSHGGCLRLGAGYLVSAWFNTVQTEDWIRAVQANSFDDLDDTMTFDGLRATAEWRF